MLAADGDAAAEVSPRSSLPLPRIENGDVGVLADVEASTISCAGASCRDLRLLPIRGSGKRCFFWDDVGDVLGVP